MYYSISTKFCFVCLSLPMFLRMGFLFLQDCLSELQLVMLADYKRLAEELKAQKMKEDFQKAISNEEHVRTKGWDGWAFLMI